MENYVERDDIRAAPSSSHRYSASRECIIPDRMRDERNGLSAVQEAKLS